MNPFFLSNFEPSTFNQRQKLTVSDKQKKKKRTNDAVCETLSNRQTSEANEAFVPGKQKVFGGKLHLHNPTLPVKRPCTVLVVRASRKLCFEASVSFRDVNSGSRTYGSVCVQGEQIECSE